MALKKCKECGKEVSTEAKTCPNCGAPVKTKSSVGCLTIIAIIFVIGMIGLLINNDKSDKTSKTQSDAPQKQEMVHKESTDQTAQIAYEVVQEWPIPNGGYGRVIVVDVRYRNEAGLRKVAEQIKNDTRGDRNAFVFIYDDKRAAELRIAALEDRLNKEDLAHHDSHMIGSYFRNANTGYHALTMMLQGVMGSAKEINL